MILEDMGGDIVHIVAISRYTNSCFIPAQKVKTKKITDNGKITYKLYGYDQGSRICPAVMDPAYKSVIVDIISKADIDSVSGLEVNGLAVDF